MMAFVVVGIYVIIFVSDNLSQVEIGWGWLFCYSGFLVCCVLRLFMIDAGVLFPVGGASAI